MKKKKGFTLIELLAVIVILALIALIAIPMIMNVIESSKKGAYEESLRNLMKATEYYETSEKILGRDIDFSNGISVLDNHIEMKNKNFKTGTIKKNDNGEFYLENVSDGNFCGNGTIDKLIITKGPCEVVEPPTPVEPFSFDSILTDEASGSNGSINIDTFGNKRFAGSNPNNYVCFGIEGDTCDEEHLYRIIGMIDGNVKMIKNLHYNTMVLFDTDNSNNWDKPATLRLQLNDELFYNNTTYIDESIKKYILNATWYIDGIPYVIGENYLSKFEIAERNSSTVDYIGLMSVTDFGYGSNNINCNRESTDLYETNNPCMSDNWLFDSQITNRTITPHTGGVSRVWHVSASGLIGTANATDARLIKPSLFLSSDIKIRDGNGSIDNPYLLKLA